MILIFRHPSQIRQSENPQIFLDQDTILVTDLISAVASDSLEDRIGFHVDSHRRVHQHREQEGRRMKPTAKMPSYVLILISR